MAFLVMDLTSLITASSALPDAPVIDLGYSQYKGVSLPNGVDQYLGMRYAAPPIKDLRFRGPQDPLTACSVQNASKFGPQCVGVGQEVNDEFAEDCLFLNVWRPSGANSSSLLPTWLFIQGGGYANNANGNYNGSEVVERSGRDIIFVNFNYRVGALGFLASKNVRQNGDLNAGLLDQRKVLEWVQENIQKFGGSQTRVVIHGDSAGAGSVAHHLAAHHGTSNNMFSGAIAESTFWPTQRTVAEMEFQYERLVEDVNCHKADDSLACLRAADIQTTQVANVDKPFPGGNTNQVPLWYFLPVVDGSLVTGSLYDSFSRGEFVRVPLMVSDDTNEGTDFAYNATDQAEVAQFMKNNYPKLTQKQLHQINQVYLLMDPPPKHAAYFPSASAAYGELTFTCPGNLMAAAMARTFGPDKVWNYRYNVRGRTEIANGMDTPHVLDLPAIFGPRETNEPTLSYASINKDIINTTMDYYISFVKVQNPNYFKNTKAPERKPWSSGSGKRMKLQTNSTQMEAVSRSQLERCQLWLKLAASMEH